MQTPGDVQLLDCVTCAAPKSHVWVERDKDNYYIEAWWECASCKTRVGKSLIKKPIDWANESMLGMI